MRSATLLSAMASVISILFSVQVYGNVSWNKKVPNRCGIKLQRSTGGISFRGESMESVPPMHFIIQSNSGKNTTPHDRGVYLRVDMESVSDNLRDIHDGDFILRVRSARGDQVEENISRWSLSPGLYLRNGDHQAWFGVDRRIESIGAGETVANTTLSLTCDH